MISQNSLASTQLEQVLEMFSNYINDMNFVINKVKKSIYEILNVQLNPSQALALPNVASVSANGKRTIDDMKKVASILRGYSRSKNVQRQEDQTRRSRIQNSSISRQSRSRLSKYSNSSVYFSRVQKLESSQRLPKQDISMVTFQIPFLQNKLEDRQTDQLMARLRSNRSMRNLSKTTQLTRNAQGATQINQTATFNGTMESVMYNNSPIQKHLIQDSPMQRKRARTFQKSISNKSISRVITETQTKFKQCLQKHQFGMNDIIKRNTECLQILKDIHTHLKNKKNKKSNDKTPQKQVNDNSDKKPVAKYQAMTPNKSPPLKVAAH